MYRAMEGHASWGRRAPGHTPETDCKHASSQLAGTWSPRKDDDQAVRPVWGGHAEVPHPVHGESKGEKFEDMLNTEAELEEANGLLAYRKSLRERLRTRVQTMEHAASVTWRALALAKVAALEREIDDLHDVELSTMQREQARVKRDAKIKATTTIQNNELKAQVNTITKQLEVEREKTAALEQQVKDQDTKIGVMEKELKEAHRVIVEETTAANLAKSEVSDLSRSLRIAKAEVVAVYPSSAFWSRGGGNKIKCVSCAADLHDMSGVYIWDTSTRRHTNTTYYM